MMKVRDLVEAHVYENEDEAIQDAVRHLLRARPEAKVQVAVHRYQTEGLSLGAAAELAAVSWAQMRQILTERGIELRLGPGSREEAEGEIQTLREFLAARP